MPKLRFIDRLKDEMNKVRLYDYYDPEKEQTFKVIGVNDVCNIITILIDEFNCEDDGK